MKNQKTLFFIHGNSSSSKVFQHIIDDVSITYSKVAVDLPGHGANTAGFLETDFTIAKYKSFLLEELEKITGDVILIGNSLGGHLALEIASKVKNLKGMVLFGTPPLKKPINFNEAFLPSKELAAFFDDTPSLKEVENIYNKAVCNKEHKALLVKDFLNTHKKVRSTFAKELTSNVFKDQYRIFRNLEVPKLIIVGDGDPSVNSAYLHQLQKETDNCKIVTVQECGHYVSYEKPMEFSVIIKRFLS